MAEINIESPDIPLADYRTLREGRELPAKVVSSEASAAAGAAANAESVPAPEAGETSEATSPEGLETEKPDKPKAPPKRGLVDEVVALRARTRELEARLQQAPKPATPVEPATVAPPPAADDPEPNADKFGDYIEYQKAWNRWDRRQDQKAEAAEAAKRAAADTERSRAAAWNERVQTAKAAKADFETVALNPDLPVTQTMGEAITDSEIGADILYHLGSHPTDAARIAKLSPVAQIREIGKLEFQLTKPLLVDEDEGGEETPQTVVAVSKAPAPVSRPQAGTQKPNPIRNIEGMTQAEYRSYRESGKIR